MDIQKYVGCDRTRFFCDRLWNLEGRWFRVLRFVDMSHWISQPRTEKQKNQERDSRQANIYILTYIRCELCFVFWIEFV